MDSDETRPVTVCGTEAMIDGQPADNVVRVRDIAPLIKRLVAEIRRLSNENRRLRN